jgi:hypothetical protein
MPWKSEGMEQYNQLHEEVHQDQLLSEAEKGKQSNQLTWLLYMSLTMWVMIMRIPVNGADKPDQRMEVVLAAKPAIQLVCSTNVMCYIGIALECTA